MFSVIQSIQTKAESQGFAPFDPWNSFSVGIGAVGTVFTTPTYGTATGYNSDHTVDQSPTLTSLGGAATFEVGKDFHLPGAMVFGIYGDLRLGSQTASSTAYGGGAISTFGSENLGVTSTLTLKNSGSIVGRAGVLVNPKTLIYGLLGYTWQQYTAQVSGYSSYNVDYNSASKSGTLGGLTAGLGAEVMLNDWLSVKGEYRFTHLGSIGSLEEYTGTPALFQEHGNTDLHQIRVVLSAKFH